LSDFNRLKSDKEELDKEFGLVSEGVTGKLNHYDFSNAGFALRNFTWNHFADWYLEIVKSREDKVKDQVLMYILKDLLKLWHPFMPFVTEAIWQEMGMKTSLMIEKWPKQDKGLIDERAEKEFEMICEIVVKIRNLRSENKIDPAKKLDVSVKGETQDIASVQKAEAAIKQLARIERFDYVSAKPAGAIGAVVGGLEIYLSMAGLVDAAKEKDRLEKEKANLINYISGLEKKLNNAEFVKNAPTAVVEAERAKLGESKGKLNKVEEQSCGFI